MAGFGEVFLADVGEGGVGEGDFRQLHGALEAAVGGWRQGFAAAEAFLAEPCERLVEIVAAEVDIPVAGTDLHHALLDADDGDIEGAAAEVINEQGLAGGGIGLAGSVGERGGGRLVDNAQHVEAGELAGVLGGETLALVEKRGHGDDGLPDRVAEVFLRGALELAEDEGADFLRAVGFPAELHGAVGAHEALDGEDGVLRGGNRLIFCGPADDELARRIDADGAGHGALGADRDDFELALADDRDGGIGGAEVDADDGGKIAVHGVGGQKLEVRIRWLGGGRRGLGRGG